MTTIICEICHKEIKKLRANQRTCSNPECKREVRRLQVRAHHQRVKPQPKKREEAIKINTRLREEMFKRCACGELYYGNALTCPFCRGAFTPVRTAYNHFAVYVA